MSLLERINAQKVCTQTHHGRKCQRPINHDGDHMDATGYMWRTIRFPARDMTWGAR